MSRLRPWLVTAVAVVMAVGLIGLVLSEHRARAEGAQVALNVGGVDPRSLLSGNYVQLDFQEALAKGLPCPPGVPRLGQAFFPQFDGREEGWVALRTVAGRTHVTGAAATREGALRHGPIAVRGKASCWSRDDEVQIVSLDIGLDRFHASQKEALELEAALRKSTLEQPTAWALVSVGRDGRARLLGLEAEGRRVLLDWF